MKKQVKITHVEDDFLVKSFAVVERIDDSRKHVELFANLEEAKEYFEKSEVEEKQIKKIECAFVEEDFEGSNEYELNDIVTSNLIGEI